MRGACHGGSDDDAQYRRKDQMLSHFDPPFRAFWSVLALPSQSDTDLRSGASSKLLRATVGSILEICQLHDDVVPNRQRVTLQRGSRTPRTSGTPAFPFERNDTVGVRP